MTRQTWTMPSSVYIYIAPSDYIPVIVKKLLYSVLSLHHRCATPCMTNIWQELCSSAPASATNQTNWRTSATRAPTYTRSIWHARSNYNNSYKFTYVRSCGSNKTTFVWFINKRSLINHNTLSTYPDQLKKFTFIQISHSFETPSAWL